MFGQKKRDNEEQLKKLEATIQDYQEKLAKDEKWFQYLDLINIETLSIIIRDSDLPIDLKKQIDG